MFLKNAKAIVLGSRVEKFPVVIIEAMASKIPFISTNVGCVKYFPGGFIVNNRDEMAYWMSFIINNPEISILYGNVGYEYASINMMVHSRVDLLLSSIQRISVK